MHIERFDSEEVDGIFDGTLYIFPKIDGTNSSVYIDEDGKHKTASRNRELTVDYDNAKFCSWALSQGYIWKFLEKHPTWHIFGEWLQPHVVKYPPHYYNNFYVFDVYDMESNRYLDYMDWKDKLIEAGFTVIPIQQVLINGNVEDVEKELDKNHYCLDNDALAGEGVVCKNPQFINSFGRQCYAKIVRKEFKANARRNFGSVDVLDKTPMEKKVVEKFLTMEWVEHEYDNYISRHEIPRVKETSKFLGIMYHEFLTDFVMQIIKTPCALDFRDINRWFITSLKTYCDMTTDKITLKKEVTNT